jgi:hypothetical protein
MKAETVRLDRGRLLKSLIVEGTAWTLSLVLVTSRRFGKHFVLRKFIYGETAAREMTCVAVASGQLRLRRSSRIFPLGSTPPITLTFSALQMGSSRLRFSSSRRYLFVACTPSHADLPDSEVGRAKLLAVWDLDSYSRPNDPAPTTSSGQP